MDEQTYTYQNEKYLQQIVALLQELIEAVSGGDDNA